MAESESMPIGMDNLLPHYNELGLIRTLYVIWIRVYQLPG